MKNISVTSVADLEKYAAGQVVELPEFAEGQPFVVRLRRPSMLSLVKNGKIPNTLLSSANSLFSTGSQSFDAEDPDAMKEMMGILDIVCEASLVEPTYEQIKSAGIELTDEQLMAIFSYSQQGVKALESFRR